MTTLCLAALGGLPPLVVRPDYDPTSVRVGIIHLGIGAFHRAHQAVFTDDLLRADPRWGICGVNLPSPLSIDALNAQDGLYTVLQKSSEGVQARVIGSLREALFLGTDRARLMARFADPAVKVVTMTVTEKGYCHDPATGKLNPAHPDIVHDRAQPALAVSAPGVLVAGLAARRAAGSGPITVVCCDNLPHNGHLVEGMVGAFAQSVDPGLADWIGRHVTFPCTMVDRIVPATTPADVAEVARLLGVADAVPVAAEPFRQWVIEDRFAAERPAWETVGAEFTNDVGLFETMKLRLLNGSHSTLAYLGFLAGFETIWQASADPDLARLIERQMAEEIIPTVVAPAGVDLHAYARMLLVRFRNTALPHRTQQIAMDGSQKLPQRLLNTVRDRLAAGGSYTHLALAVAGWIRYASGSDEAGKPIAVSDPMAPTFAAIAQRAGGDPARLAAGFLDLTAVFGDDLSTHPAFRSAVTRNVEALRRDGVRKTLAAHLARS
jgi:fructuronate reductase